MRDHLPSPESVEVIVIVVMGLLFIAAVILMGQDVSAYLNR